MSPFTLTNPVILTGPTGVGKTAAAIEISRLLPLRVISMDSMQVYRRMDIGTAKPTTEQQRMVPHYCLDLVDPDYSFSVAEYLQAALPAIRETQEAGALPLLVGGTRLYLYALTGAFREGSPPLPEYRAQLTLEAEEHGTEVLHARLSQVDPVAASRIFPNDLKRIIRALEVHQATGKTISQVQEESRQVTPLVNALKIALVRDREELYTAVEARTEAMLREGWLEEVEGLLRDGYGPSLSSTKAHGYRELAAYLQGEMELAEAKEIINKNIRHYVRYQLGWIRQMPDVHVIQAGDTTGLLAALDPV